MSIAWLACSRSPVLQGCHVQLRNYPPAFGEKLVTLFDDMISDKAGVPQLPAEVPSAVRVWLEMGFEDPWEEAKMSQVCHWLRGSRDLKIPLEWRSLLPSRL